MSRNISKHTRKELLGALRSRYQDASKQEKGLILKEFVAVSGYHRKHATRLLSREWRNPGGPPSDRGSRRVYDEAVKEALIVTWEAADRICGKRLKAVLPDIVDAMERNGHLGLDAEVRERLLKISAASIDRVLSPIRDRTRRRKKKRKSSEASGQIPVRTFGDWGEPAPGHLEIDFVAHGGGSMAGSFIHTLAQAHPTSYVIGSTPR